MIFPFVFTLHHNLSVWFKKRKSKKKETQSWEY